MPLSDHQIPESDNESDSSGQDLVNLAQPPTRPPSPGQSASGQPAILSQQSRPLSPPLPGVETAPLQPPIPQYSFHPTKAQLIRGSQASSSTERQHFDTHISGGP